MQPWSYPPSPYLPSPNAGIQASFWWLIQRIFAEHPACTSPVLETRSNNKTQWSTGLCSMELMTLPKVGRWLEALLMNLPANSLHPALKVWQVVTRGWSVVEAELALGASKRQPVLCLYPPSVAAPSVRGHLRVKFRARGQREVRARAGWNTGSPGNLSGQFASRHSGTF